MPNVLRPTNATFVEAVTQRAMAQIANVAGYKSAETEAIEALTATTKVFIQEIGKMARAHAELSGRNQVNSFDIAAALLDYGQSVDQLNGFVQHSDPLPFFHTNLPYAAAERSIVVPRIDSQSGDDIAHLAHIPEYLPPFPARLTFSSTKDVPVDAPDVEGLRKRKFEQSRAVEAGLVEIQSAREAVKHGATTDALFGAIHDSKDDAQELVIVSNSADPPQALDVDRVAQLQHSLSSSLTTSDRMQTTTADAHIDDADAEIEI